MSSSSRCSALRRICCAPSSTRSSQRSGRARQLTARSCIDAGGRLGPGAALTRCRLRCERCAGRGIPGSKAGLDSAAPGTQVAGGHGLTPEVVRSMSNQHPDFYAALGIPADATPAQISHAYRDLLRRHHPDIRDTEDSEQRVTSDAALRQGVAAYAVLHDPNARERYDRERSPGVHVRPRWAPPNSESPIQAGPVRWHRRPAR